LKFGSALQVAPRVKGVLHCTMLYHFVFNKKLIILNNSPSQAIDLGQILHST